MPLSDSVFVERQRDRLARGTSQVAFNLIAKSEQFLDMTAALDDNDGGKMTILSDIGGGLSAEDLMKIMNGT